MLTLYYSPGAVSLAVHILLFELGLPFESLAFPTKAGANLSPEYLKVNPTGQLPALKLPNGEVLTENSAILPYLAQLEPEMGLWPVDALQQARIREKISFMASAVHPAFTLSFKPQRWGFDEDILLQIKAASRARFIKMLGFLQAQHIGPYALGAFSVVDSHLLVILLWAKVIGIDLGAFPTLKGMVALMLERESVQQALKAEGLWERYGIGRVEAN